MKNYQELLEKFNKHYQHFPDGRIDYSGTHEALAVVVFVVYNEELLLLKRSGKVRAYKEKWDVVAGYYDELVTPEEKTLEELREEAGITNEHIAKMYIADMVTNHDTEINKIWHDVPVIVILREKPVIQLDFEHTEYAWVAFPEIGSYDIVSVFRDNLRTLLPRLYDYSKKHFT